MKYFLSALGLAGSLTLCLAAQTTQTVRPRVAPTATPTIKNDTTAVPDPVRTAPVLKGAGVAPSQAQAKPTPTPGKDEDEIVKVETNLVTMPVSVLDREGRFISGLAQKDFKIFENGIEQKVDYFQSVEQPFTAVLMIDVSPSTQWQIEEIQRAAGSFVDQLRPTDKVLVISFDENVHILSNVTSDRYQLKNAIARSRFGDGTSLYEAVDHVLEQELSQIQGRKAVVLFTDGVDTTSESATYDTTVREAEEADAMIYTIRYDTSRDMNPGYGRGPGGGSYPPSPGRTRSPNWADILGSIVVGGNLPPGVYTGRRGRAGNSPEEYETGKKYLEAIAQNSGGRKFEADSLVNLDAAFSGIAEELRRQYSLGYYPDKIGEIGERRSISIRVNRPAVVVRAKNSYIVGQTDRRLAGK